MRHPLEFIPGQYRKRFFFTFLFLTLILFAVFRVLDEPLQTPAAPNGIVSFELARTPEKARLIVDTWTGRVTVYASPDGENVNATPVPPDDSSPIDPTSLMYAAFGLGIDYLFMPLYAFALAFGTLLAAGRHSGWIKSLGAVAGYGAFAAAFFDAVENFALFQTMLGAYESSHPAIAAACATIKFGLLIFGLLYALAGWLLPRKSF